MIVVLRSVFVLLLIATCMSTPVMRDPACLLKTQIVAIMKYERQQYENISAGIGVFLLREGRRYLYEKFGCTEGECKKCMRIEDIWTELNSCKKAYA